VSEFLNLLAAGLTSGGIYGIFGACLAVWFRVCNVLNLAVGDFAMLGAIGTARLVQTDHLPFAAGVVVVLAAVGLIAWIFDRVVLHIAFDRGLGAHGIVGVFFYTFGLSLVLEGGPGRSSGRTSTARRRSGRGRPSPSATSMCSAPASW
jgi:branched-chain amino acid transport system permease protein